MSPEQEVACVSSKEILTRTGISRATLNNYIALGLVPRPAVRKPDYAEGPTKIGHFPTWVLDRLQKVRELKHRGMRIPEIVAYLRSPEFESAPLEPSSPQRTAYDSIDGLPFPAVFVNRRWEILWLNDHAEQILLGKRIRDILTPRERNLFRLFFGRQSA